ncbi:MAG: GNAT family N-acetyltransferase [Firmicutes bacterium]|nr:GNAT family N-acetyltransferase [Bacillota bacterium]
MKANSQVSVREITKDEIGAAFQFIRDNYRKLYKSDFNPRMHYKILSIEEYYLKPVDCALLAAFNTDGEIIGVITVEPYDDRIPVLRSIYDPGRTAELSRCYVDKRCRRAGIGSMLFEEAQLFCLMNGYQVLYLHTHQFLPGALEFWQSRGFVVRIEAGDEHGTLHMDKSLYFGQRSCV